ncbi:MAG: gamma-glutamyltransferase family protein [Beijerinckiaceae bacterium]
MPETPRFPSAAVAAPHHLASEAGRAVLAEGGNAIEAMIAMAATIAVVYPHMNSIGGDGFWLIREPGGKTRAIEACGPAGSLATTARYREKGYEVIPPRGPDAALTVAGAIGGWQEALALSSERGGRLPLSLLMSDAITHARTGYSISLSEGRYQPKELEALLEAPGFVGQFWPDGKRPDSGTRRSPSALANTLEHLARVGLDDFYRGDIGREIAADHETLGSPITRADMAAFRARAVEALSIELPGVTVYNFPPPTQGLASLLILGIFEKLSVAKAESFEHHHGLIEATKRAFMIRNAHITDPDFLTASPVSFLTDQVFAREAAQINMKKAAEWPIKTGDGDTIWMGAIDKDGLAVSYIQSLYWEYGSSCVLPRTGINWQNRGVAFSLDPKSPNPLQPGRKPFHTLNPALAVFNDGRVMSYGAMGGDGQPQFQAQIFSRYRYGQSVAASIDAPRWLWGKTWGETSAALKMENRFDHLLVTKLAVAGHHVEEWSAPYADGFGHAGMLVKYPGGHVEAAHDPRSDGDARGL